RQLEIDMSKAYVVGHGVKVTDDEVLNFWNRNTEKVNRATRYYTPDVTRVQVIMTTTEEAANKANTDLLKGIPFQTVATNYSVDASKSLGGLMPPAPRGMTGLAKIPGMEDAVFAMKINETIGPRKFLNRWWIIKCVDFRPAKKIPFAEVKGECR